MSKQTEALKLALEALGYFEKAGLATLKTIDAITAIREALAEQPEHAQTIKDQEAAIHRLQKRYAELEAKVGKPWVGLTEEEFSHGLQMASNTSWMKAAKWVEAKLREKNEWR